MNWDNLLFGIAPYVAIALAVGVSIYRYRTRKFSYSSLSSQLLEHKLLFWGSIPFHWGLVTILLGHFAAFLVPQAILAWNGHPLRLLLLEGTGLALGLWALAGLFVLFMRRMNHPRIQAVSTGMDFVTLAVLLVSVTTGVATAISYRWGSNWFAAVASPYLWSLLALQPRTELVASLPFLVKLHIFNFWVFLAIFPFTRLVHILTVPFQYLVRPWQIVVWNRIPGGLRRPPSLRPQVATTTQDVHLPRPEAVPQLKPRAAQSEADKVAKSG